VQQRLAVDGELAARGVEAGQQQRARRRRAHEPHGAGEAVGVQARVAPDVEHRRLRERADDLVRAGQHGVGALLQRAAGQVGMEAEMGTPGLVDHERHPGFMCGLRAARHVGGHPVVRRRDDERRAGLRLLGEHLAQRLRADAVGHAQLVVVLRRDEDRHAARQHEAVNE
jgi:hypothetical protein